MKGDSRAEPIHSRIARQCAEHERWIRLPVSGRCPYSGLSRAHFYELIRAGKIKSASLKRPGCLTGVRVVWLPSVMEYIERHVEHHEEVAQ